MKHRRFPALFLSLILTFSLAAPAWALEPPVSQPPAEAGEETVYLSLDEFIEKYIEEHSEYYEAFDADAYFAQNYDWCTKEEYMNVMGLDSEEDFKQVMWKRYASYEIYQDDELYQELCEAYDAYILEVYEQRHPGELDSLTTEDLLARQGYTDTLTPAQQYMKDHGLESEDEVRPSLLVAYASKQLDAEEKHVRFLSYQKAYSDKWAEFDADTYFIGNYYGEDTDLQYFESYKASYMEWEGLLTEEDFTEDMFIKYVENNRWLWEMENGKLDQTYVPEPSLVVNGQTYAGNSFTLVDGTSYLASDELSAILGATLETSDGDPAPIRAAAEAAGWDVVWNEYHRQVILLDREKLMTGYIIPYTWEYVPCDFSGYAELTGRLNAAQPGEGRSLRTKASYDVALTLMDSLDGDKTYHFGLDGEMLSRDRVYNLDLTLDLAGLRELLGEALLEDLLSSLSPVDRETLLENLGALRFRAIWDQGEGNLAWNLPILSLLEPSFDPETWFVQNTDPDSLSDMETMTLSDPGALNELLYTILLEECAANDSRWSDGETIYQSFLASKMVLNALAGDVAITRSGDDLVWDLASGMTSLWETVYSFGYYDELPALTDLFREFTCRLTVATDGTTTAEVSIRPDMEAIAQASASEWDSPMETAVTAFLLNMVDFRYTAQGQSKGGTGTAHMEFQLKNQFKLAVDVKSEARGSDDLPLTQPPEDSPVQGL